MKIIRLIKGMFGRRRIHRIPIIDNIIHADKPDSFAGGTLCGEFFSLNSESTIDTSLFLSIAEREGIFITKNPAEQSRHHIYVTNAISEDALSKISMHLILLRDSIIECHSEIISICVVAWGDDSVSSRVVLTQFKTLIHGWAFQLSRKVTVVCNGIFANSDSVPLQTVYNAAIFLSSRYGQIMNGEVLELE